jgi:hypothetical protein
MTHCGIRDPTGKKVEQNGIVWLLVHWLSRMWPVAAPNKPLWCSLHIRFRDIRNCAGRRATPQRSPTARCPSLPERKRRSCGGNPNQGFRARLSPCGLRNDCGMHMCAECVALSRKSVGLARSAGIAITGRSTWPWLLERRSVLSAKASRSAAARYSVIRPVTCPRQRCDNRPLSRCTNKSSRRR